MPMLSLTEHTKDSFTNLMLHAQSQLNTKLTQDGFLVHLINCYSKFGEQYSKNKKTKGDNKNE